MRRRSPSHRLKQFAHDLRARATKAEIRLWKELRARRFLGYKFRRQHPLAIGYILDFYSPYLKLAIEVDGGYHKEPEQALKDARRDSHCLHTYGITTVRFTNDDVIYHPDKVFTALRAKIVEVLEKDGRKVGKAFQKPEIGLELDSPNGETCYDDPRSSSLGQTKS